MTTESSGEGRDVTDRVGALLNEVEHRLDEGHPDEALILAQQSIRLIQRHEDLSRDLRIDAHYLLASCQFEQRDVSAALHHYQQVRRLDPKDAEIDYWQARALFHLWRFDAAQELLDAFEPNENTKAGSFYYRALIRDFRGEPDRAEDLFAQAEEEDPTEFPRPFRLQRSDLESFLRVTLESLPLAVRRALQDVEVQMHALPNPSLYASPEFDPLISGLCRRRGERALGPSRLQHDANGIELYQRNMERVSTDRDELAEELRRTLLVEIEHQLGRFDDFGDERN